MKQNFLNSDALSELSNEISGEVLRSVSRDPQERRRYVQAREVFNGAVDAQPAIIVLCKSTQDVTKAIQFVKREGLNFSIRSGGHHAYGASLMDQGVVIDLSHMTDFSYDVENKTATLQPGCTWTSVNEETYKKHSLVLTHGECPSVLLAGYTLGGGYGLTSRAFGLGCDNLLSAEVVLADGSVVQASSTENKDLYWALRGGGGGNFGVVTSLTVRLHPLPQQVLCGMVAWPIDQAEDVMKFYRDLYQDENTPDELSFCMLMTNIPYPEGDPLIILYGVYAGEIEDGRQHIEKITSFGEPAVVNTSEAPYSDFMVGLGSEIPHGLKSKWRGGYLNEEGFSDSAIHSIVSEFKQQPSKYSQFRFDLLGGGAIARVSKDETAFRHRDELFNLLIVSFWDHDSEAQINMKWVDECVERLSRIFNGYNYQNYANDGLVDWQSAYYGGNYAKLQRVKKEYDKDNFFNSHQSIELPQ
ncbi:FAD linked oxidase domain protein [Rhodobacteraceae bacterium KLH11]|nr:FAD linked oxidase domain protein [Rhodobacteraceae bacterium KLH11]